MKLLDILLLELESWPEGKEYAYQSSTTSMAYFVSPIEEDKGFKTIQLCQISPNRGPDHKVTREQWKTAKIKSLPFFNVVASALGEERAVKELLAVGPINDTAEELDAAFVFCDTPQGHEFWEDILEPNRRADKLKEALNVITAAMSKANPKYCIRLQVDGSGSVRDQDYNEIIYFSNTDSLVKKYLAPTPTPKFEHWDLLQDRFEWVAKDSNGYWWAYEGRPTLEAFGWKVTVDCRSLEIMKIEIPCHWTNSLIKRPTSSGESH